MADNDNIARQTLDADKLDRAIRLRVRGAHWSEVAEACGYPSPAAALKAVGTAMEESTQRAAETADQMRDTANLRLEYLFKQTLDMLDSDAPMDLEGNTPDDRAVKLRAVDEARRLVESQNKLNGVGPKEEASSESGHVLKVVGIQVEDII